MSFQSMPQRVHCLAPYPGYATAPIHQPRQAMTAKSAPPKSRRMPAGSTSSVRYRTLVDKAPLGILFVNANGYIETVNTKLLAILGLEGVSTSGPRRFPPFPS